MLGSRPQACGYLPSAAGPRAYAQKGLLSSPGSRRPGENLSFKVLENRKAVSIP